MVIDSTWTVLRDTQERGRDLEQVLATYSNFVKPAFEEFCLPVSNCSVLNQLLSWCCQNVSISMHNLGKIIELRHSHFLVLFWWWSEMKSHISASCNTLFSMDGKVCKQFCLLHDTRGHILACFLKILCLHKIYLRTLI